MGWSSDLIWNLHSALYELIHLNWYKLSNQYSSELKCLNLILNEEKSCSRFYGNTPWNFFFSPSWILRNCIVKYIVFTFFQCLKKNCGNVYRFKKNMLRHYRTFHLNVSMSKGEFFLNYCSSMLRKIKRYKILINVIGLRGK